MYFIDCVLGKWDDSYVFSRFGQAVQYVPPAGYFEKIMLLVAKWESFRLFWIASNWTDK